MLQLKRLYYRLSGRTDWYYDTGEITWKRYNLATDRWETREMTPAEANESYWQWAIK